MTTPFEGLAINGQRLPSASGHNQPIYNPANNEIITHVAWAGEEDVDKAVQAAHHQFKTGAWRKINSRVRGQLMLKLAQLIRDNRDRLAQLESSNTGKPIKDARDEMGAVANTFTYYAGAINKFFGQTIPGAADGTLMTFHEPIGVCGLIVPWNYPLIIMGWKVAPALAMGNTVVLKPAEATPLTALALADLALEAGFPAGVLNVVPGDGPVAGAALVRHPLVRKVSFTGSTVTGSKIMHAAADGIKRISLELGGKSANIVFADADLDVCIESSLYSIFSNTGQDCCARSRLLVQRPIFDQFVDRFVNLTTGLRVGDPAAKDTQIGPLITPQHRQRVQSYLDSGDAEGAQRLCGGEGLTDPILSKGNFMTPAVYVNVQPQMRIVREEIFGPVVCVIPFDSEEEALNQANDSSYGLSGSVWTRDIGRALRVVRQFETGMISVNSSSSVHIEAPFGGVKQSGMGREQGMAALEHYSEYKSVFIASS